MATKRILGAPVWPYWVISVLIFALFAEYLRLVLTTNTPSYRIVVTVVLGIGFVVSLIRLLKAMRNPNRSTGSQH